MSVGWKSCLLTFKNVYSSELYCISYWWEMLEKLKEITIEIVITLFFNSCLVWRGEEKIIKKKTRKGGVFLEHFELAIKWSPVNQITVTVAFDEQKQYKLFPRVIQRRLRAGRNASAKWSSTAGVKFLMLFNVSTFLSHVWNFYIVIFSSRLGYSIFFVSICCVK